MTNALWYLGRGTGVVSLVLLTIVVALGIANRSSRSVLGLPRFAVAQVHRNAALLAVSLLAVHVTTLLFDPYAQLRLVDLVLPFAGAYRPFWLGLGTLALDLMLALTITSLIRHRLGPRTWRVVHWLAYAAWPVAWLHGIGTGTDNRVWWLQVVVWTCAAAVLVAVGWRFSDGFSDQVNARRLPANAPVTTPSRPGGAPRSSRSAAAPTNGMRVYR